VRGGVLGRIQSSRMRISTNCVRSLRARRGVMVPRLCWNLRASTQYWNHYQRNSSRCHRASLSRETGNTRPPGHDSIAVMKEISVHPNPESTSMVADDDGLGGHKKPNYHRVFIIPRPHKGDEYPITRTPTLLAVPPVWRLILLVWALLAFSFSFESYFYVFGVFFLLCELTLYQVLAFFFPLLLSLL